MLGRTGQVGPGQREFQDHRGLMILELSLPFGIKSKIMTNDLLPEEPHTHVAGF